MGHTLQRRGRAADAIRWFACFVLPQQDGFDDGFALGDALGQSDSEDTRKKGAGARGGTFQRSVCFPACVVVACD